MPLLRAKSPTQHSAATLYKGSTSVGQQVGLAPPPPPPPLTVMRGETLSVVSCRRTSFLPFLLGFLRQLILKVNSSICWNVLHYFAVTASKHPGWADPLQRRSFLIQPTTRIIWRVDPLVWNIAFLHITFALGMFQWCTVLHKWVHPKYCTYLLPSGMFQENACVEKAGHSFYLWSTMGWEQRSLNVLSNKNKKGHQYGVCLIFIGEHCKAE